MTTLPSTAPSCNQRPRAIPICSLLSSICRGSSFYHSLFFHFFARLFQLLDKPLARRSGMMLSARGSLNYYVPERVEVFALRYALDNQARVHHQLRDFCDIYKLFYYGREARGRKYCVYRIPSRRNTDIKMRISFLADDLLIYTIQFHKIPNTEPLFMTGSIRN